MSTDQAVILLNQAEEAGYLRQENGIFTICFDPASVTIPIGFRPSSAIFEAHDPTQELISRIMQSRGIDETSVVAEMNAIIRDKFDGNLLPPAALVLLAKKYGVPYDDFRNSLISSIKK